MTYFIIKIAALQIAHCLRDRLAVGDTRKHGYPNFLIGSSNDQSEMRAHVSQAVHEHIHASIVPGIVS